MRSSLFHRGLGIKPTAPHAGSDQTEIRGLILLLDLLVLLLLSAGGKAAKKDFLFPHGIFFFFVERLTFQLVFGDDADRIWD